MTPERPRDPNQLAKSISNLAPHYPLAAPQLRLAAPHVAPSGPPKVCSTAAIPALVTCNDTGFVEPSVTGTSAPDEEV